jgi:predicted ATPase/DNA-binding winged helix-turn-helix (wHTH) protein
MTSDALGTEHRRISTFGSFRLIPSQGLYENGRPCRIGPRAMETLLALVERAGETIKKSDLIARVWPETGVDEANLRMQISALRSVLGDGHAGARFIVNVMGQGYCFVAPVTQIESLAEQSLATPNHDRKHNLPPLQTRVLGRDEAIEEIAIQTPLRRCVTVVGPGGIGKTTVAIRAAERLLTAYDDGVWFVDLTAIQDRELIPSQIAAVLGLSVTRSAPIAAITTFLRDRKLLILLDNCEHVINSAASLVTTLVRETMHVGVLATSREPLRIDDEWVYRLRPVGTPPEAVALTADQALTYPAVRLFVERATSKLDGFILSDTDASLAGGICRQLDGIPLAIELAATRVDMFGMRGLAAVINDEFLLTSQGLRTAQPRQQSLLATLDWSYRLLTSVEQTILRRLAVFRGDFAFDAALAVAGSDGVRTEDVYACILTLSEKSLLVTDVFDDTSHHHHRLLHVTRSYLLTKLSAEEAADIARRHAEYLCNLMKRGENDWQIFDRRLWIRVYGRYLDDIRAALDWAFSPGGDLAIGVALTVLAIPLIFQISLVDECRRWVERALLHCGTDAAAPLFPEMRLNIALGRLTQNVLSDLPGRAMGFDRALEIAHHLGEPIFLVEPFIGLAAFQLGSGDYARASETAAKAIDSASASLNPLATLASRRVVAQACHFNGDHSTAARHASDVLSHPALQIPFAFTSMPVDRRVSMRIILARVAWLEGRVATAAAVASECIQYATDDSALSLCQALALAAIPIALWNGEDESAHRLTNLLVGEAERYTLAHWQSWAAAFRALLDIRAGIGDQQPLLGGPLQTDTFVTFSTELLSPLAIRRAETGAAGWCEPEVYRARGEWLIGQRAPDADQLSEALFTRAITVARQHGALAWELRAATSLAGLYKRWNRATEGYNLLTAVLRRLPESVKNSDSAKATELITELDRNSGATPPTATRRLPRSSRRIGQPGSRVRRP